MVEARDHKIELHMAIEEALRRQIDIPIVDLLTAAGWTLAPPGSRVVPEGGVDAETVERCAAYLERVPSFGDGKWAARHLRSLAPVPPTGIWPNWGDSPNGFDGPTGAE